MEVLGHVHKLTSFLQAQNKSPQDIPGAVINFTSAQVAKLAKIVFESVSYSL